MNDVIGIFQKCYDFTEAIEARQVGIYPYFKPIEGSRGSKVIIGGRELVMAGSNNYLGLALDPEVREASIKAIKEYGTSCSGSRFMNGTLALHEELEERLASFTGKQAALCFTTGYQTNLGSISALVGRGEHVITDKSNHASIMDGIFLALGLNRKVNIHRFKHNNLEDLERKLSSIPSGESKLIVTDGVFSMDGDIVKLPEMRALADKYRVGVYLDEAHAIGVIGKTGRGTTEYYGDRNLADLIMCTFSKAFGSIGGFVAGEERVIDYIKHVSRPLIFSASMPPANIAAVMAALDIIEREPQRVLRLQQIAQKMIERFTELGFNIGTTETAIVPLIIGDNQKTFLFWKNLFERGVYVNPVVSPGVPPNRALIRTSYMATHTDKELDQILEIAAQEGKKLGII
ncbi:MAG: pyridoxal phosphate-dependent aminotransferase family protein [Deltaproteobacteria bacterium]|nr:pyridoxal phosphate-dependent aminotransferase family protein [Deltaproteobacteria bacterium]MBW2339431.1 pyridoxal phosphate-dependent aminotransferase family protein [Deltaproteobacteria bacterium]